MNIYPYSDLDIDAMQDEFWTNQTNGDITQLNFTEIQEEQTSIDGILVELENTLAEIEREENGKIESLIYRLRNGFEALNESIGALKELR